MSLRKSTCTSSTTLLWVLPWQWLMLAQGKEAVLPSSISSITSPTFLT